ncbi:MAG: hypothetical protein RSD81_15105 [Pseudomonas sp.]
MRNSFKWRAALLLAFALLGGCGPIYVNEYTPPAKLKDVNCLNTCTMEVKRCNYLRSQQHKNNQIMYESDVESFERCEVGRNIKEISKHCKRPRYPQDNPKYACESSYDSCYLSCGGTIERVPLF